MSLFHQQEDFYYVKLRQPRRYLAIENLPYVFYPIEFQRRRTNDYSTEALSTAQGDSGTC